jgi:hypothetical protein
VLCDLNEQSVNQWQNEWGNSSKRANTKYFFFPKISDTLKVRINATPNFTAIVTGHGNIKTYLYKYIIIESPKCTCEEGDQSVDYILFDFKLSEHDRVRLKAEVTRSEKWPVSRDKLGIKFYKYFKEFTSNIKLDTV